MKLYDVDSINETNVFVVKKDGKHDHCLMTGAIVHRPNYDVAAIIKNKHRPAYNHYYFPITDEMLADHRVKGAKQMRFVTEFPFVPYGDEHRTPTYEYWPNAHVRVRPCQLRRATKEEVEKCKKYARKFNEWKLGLMDKYIESMKNTEATK